MLPTPAALVPSTVARCGNVSHTTQFAYSRRDVNAPGPISAEERTMLAETSFPPSLLRLLGTCGRVSTSNGLQPLLERRFVLIRARLASRFYEALPLALCALRRCLCHDEISNQASLPHIL